MSEAAYYFVKGQKRYYVTCRANAIDEIIRELDNSGDVLKVSTDYNSFGDGVADGKTKRAADGSFEIEAFPVDNGLYVIDVDRKIIIDACDYYRVSELKKKVKGWQVKTWSPKIKV